MTVFRIDIISDTVCPWCYIGARKLSRAIALYQKRHGAADAGAGSSSASAGAGQDTFAINWLPYQLNPRFPAGTSEDKREHFSSRYGAGRLAQMEQIMGAAGREVGITFRFGGRTGNTRDSHRLIELAKQKGKGNGDGDGDGSVQDQVVEQLFKAYFEDEKDITDHAILVEVAVKAGIDAAEARDWLESGKGGDTVDREIQHAFKAGITGVPHFTVQGKYRLGGAQDPEDFVELFESVKHDEAQ